MPEESLSINRALQILSLQPSADTDEVQAAWRRAVRLAHPDRNTASNPVVARRRFDEVQEAYRVLSNPAVVKQRRLARANAPLAPFTGNQLEAFRALGLGPGSTYDEISSRAAQLLREGADSGVIKDARATLLNPHLQAQGTWSGTRSGEARSQGWQGARRTARAKNNSGFRAILYASLALMMTIAAAVLIKTPRMPVLVSIFTALMALACFLASLREAKKYG